MERLTQRDRKGRAYFDDDGSLIRGANGTFHQKKDMTAHYIHQRFVALDKAIDLLAAYEDTGFMPDEIKAWMRHGRWILDSSDEYANHYSCSRCGGEIDLCNEIYSEPTPGYCQFCGARMDEGEDHE